jgi:hypothetical protein
MKMLIAAVAVGGLMLSPLVAASGGAAAKEVKASKTHVIKHKPTRTIRSVRAPGYIRAQAPSAFSPYAHRPEYDAHIRGTVVGSDPDPRVRRTLRREYCEDSPSSC